MSKFYDNHKAHEETRVKNSLRREKLASYFFDVSKLSLGGVVFTSAFGWFNDRDNYEYMAVTAVGVVMVVIFAFIANKLLNCKQTFKMNMFMLGSLLIYGFGAVFGVCFYVWISYTKSGKKWLKEL